jgi:hypothetical protein
VGVDRTADVEPLGIVEHLLVEVGGSEVERRPLTLPHRVAADLSVLEGGALQDNRRRRPAQDLVDRGLPSLVSPPLDASSDYRALGERAERARLFEPGPADPVAAGVAADRLLQMKDRLDADARRPFGLGP